MHIQRIEEDGKGIVTQKFNELESKDRIPSPPIDSVDVPTTNQHHPRVFRGRYRASYLETCFVADVAAQKSLCINITLVREQQSWPVSGALATRRHVKYANIFSCKRLSQIVE